MSIPLIPAIPKNNFEISSILPYFSTRTPVMMEPMKPVPSKSDPHIPEKTLSYPLAQVIWDSCVEKALKNPTAPPIQTNKTIYGPFVNTDAMLDRYCLKDFLSSCPANSALLLGGEGG